MRFLFLTLGQLREPTSTAGSRAELADGSGTRPRTSPGRAVGAVAAARGAARAPDARRAAAAAAAGRRSRRRAARGSSAPTRCARCATSTAPTGRPTGRPEPRSAERTVRHFLALERVFDEVAPGRRRARGGLRDHPDRRAPHRRSSAASTSSSSSTRSSRGRCACTRTPCTRRSSPPRSARARAGRARRRSRRSSAEFTDADRPIRAYREPRVTRATLRDFARHVAVAADARPRQRVPAAGALRHELRCARRHARRVARRLYEPLDASERPFVYFPLHVTDDYKIKRVIPHCVDQAAIIELIADVAAAGHRPGAQGAPDVDRPQPARPAAAASRRENIRLVDPYTSSHELIRRVAGGRRHLVDRRARGAAARPAGADRRPAVLRGLRRDAGRGLVPRDPRQGAGAARVSSPTASARCSSCTRRCAAAIAGRPAAVDDSDDNARDVAASLDARGQPRAVAIR